MLAMAASACIPDVIFFLNDHRRECLSFLVLAAYLFVNSGIIKRLYRNGASEQKTEKELSQSPFKLSVGHRWRLGIVLVFLYVYTFTASSGVFLFDNRLIVNSSWDADFRLLKTISIAYEWSLLVLVTCSLYYSLTLCRRLTRNVTTQQLVILTTVVAITTCLFSIEYRAYKAQRATADFYAKQGGFFCFVYHSSIFAGQWYEFLVLKTGLCFSVWGGVSWITRIIGVKSRLVK